MQLRIFSEDFKGAVRFKMHLKSLKGHFPHLRLFLVRREEPRKVVIRDMKRPFLWTIICSSGCFRWRWLSWISLSDLLEFLFLHILAFQTIFSRDTTVGLVWLCFQTKFIIQLPNLMFYNLMFCWNYITSSVTLQYITSNCICTSLPEVFSLMLPSIVDDRWLQLVYCWKTSDNS